MRIPWASIALGALAFAGNSGVRCEDGPAKGTLRIVQAFAGFNQPNDLGAPCASPCFGTAAGTVVVQPNQFVSSNSTGLYYAALQTNRWTGTLSTTFELSEGGAVVQTVTTGASVGTDQATSALVLSAAATIPQSSYVGPALLIATTTATPSNGGASLTLKSHSTLEVGGAGTRRVVQAFVGISEPAPCLGVTCGVPSGAVAVHPDLFPQPHSAGVYYAVFQANGWVGSLNSSCEVTESGAVVQTVPIAGFVAGSQAYSVVALGEAGVPLPGSYVGPAAMIVTTTASVGGGAQFTLRSSTALEVQ